ncbi:MAG: tRNA (adenosine(37)-N6)-threonylcarbamoyltransferase complex ATPase subunit type 1 TsaE [Candidatus Aminicenantes bacterium]|nr:tRNA (adenosine(37)-N6)-threonylcarbamoyltransferase complex ATPase subunit type 1 TsaE [Candidatus Aminicenantes bacterium]MDH5386116.1 tRNA (adenosine(37)-N6)-threonylcarbamoyltransferase complex ATPase subunit type 1 TsaE [Candidatus Aminicenantes bacterium]
MKTHRSKKDLEVHTTSSERETFLIAKKLAESFEGREVVLLIGELGAGKTVFAKGIAAGLGLEDVHQVCSPSFTLVNIYQAKFPIYHIDLYRLGKESEIEDLGWEDYLDRGVIIVEWAKKLRLGMESIRVTIEVEADDTRKIKIEH